MNLHVIACNVLSREISLVAAECSSALHIHFIEQGLHDRPDYLRDRIQKKIDEIDDASGKSQPNAATVTRDPPDAIVLAYGLCSNAICGLRSRHYPLVAPRAHDCLTLILGSRERYQEYFDRHPGTYWFSPGWIEQTPVPGKERVEKLREQYAERYGEDNADYLMDMEQEWLKSYDRCAYVSWPELHRDEYRTITRDSAAFLEWDYDELPGSADLLRRILDGQWNHDDVVVVAPGASIEPSFSESIIRPTD